MFIKLFLSCRSFYSKLSNLIIIYLLSVSPCGELISIILFCFILLLTFDEYLDYFAEGHDGGLLLLVDWGRFLLLFMLTIDTLSYCCCFYLICCEFTYFYDTMFLNLYEDSASLSYSSVYRFN